MINIIIVEDNETIREGLRILIDGTENYHCSATFSNCEDMLKKIKKLEFDIMLMDIDLPGMSGIEGIRKVKEIYPDSIMQGQAVIWLKKLLPPDCLKQLKKPTKEEHR
jgi:YesN/AraC family two-component response regulator